VNSASANRHKRPFILKPKFLHLCLLAFATSIIAVVISLWTIAHFHAGMDRGSFYIQLDSVNEFAWTIVPILAVICIRFPWSTVDTYFRQMQPYISLSNCQQIEPLTIATDYRTPLVGWITVKAFANKKYMLSAITAISLLNKIFVLGIGGKLLATTQPCRVRTQSHTQRLHKVRP
jgi:heme/copper-type cytochrome/quinol oxidase subunit 2